MPHLHTRELQEERDATDDTQVHDEIDALFNYLEEYQYHLSSGTGILVPEDEWLGYTQQLVDECYGKPKIMSDDSWPWRHLTFDWEAAAEELKGDYIEVEFRGKTYIAV